MTVIGDKEDQFPIGMRVLAVDDDPTCLLLLETLLRRCKYKVTTTNQAITALKLLRENKDKFDLVISDVHMPDMDGFKLLEHVGLEMDIPVIMLSAYSDPELVMKGITHGACNYLLKPVRIEELKNIWQHVIRRRCDNKDRNNGGSGDKAHHGNDEGIIGQKLNKKRKDQKQDEEEVADENGHENQDPMTQKKPRVVWSVDLHGKFVAAVNQLGIDNAVPKKILALMNVDKLTRENVASHLQKYKLYLRKFSVLANEQASMVASMNTLGIQHLAGPAHLRDAALRPLLTVGMFGRLNSPAVLGMQNLPSPGLVHFGQIQAPGHLYNSQSYHEPNILQGMPISVELDGSMHQDATRTREILSITGIATGFPASNAFAEGNVFVQSSAIPFNGVSNKPVTLEKCLQGVSLDPKNRKESPSNVTSVASKFSSDYVDHGRCSDGWSGSVSSSGVPSNSFALSDYFGEAPLHPSDVRETMSTMSLQKKDDPFDFSSIAAMPIHLQDSKADSIGGNVSLTIDYTQRPYGQKMDSIYHLNCAHHSSTDSVMPVNQNESPMVQSSSPNQLMFHWTGGLCSTRESNICESSSMNHDADSNSAGAMLGRPSEGFMISQQCTQGTYNFNNSDSLEDLVTAMMKQDKVKVKFTEDTGGYQAYSHLN